MVWPVVVSVGTGLESECGLACGSFCGHGGGIGVWSDLGQFLWTQGPEPDRMRKGVGHNMHFTYCPHCGNKLIQKEIGDEGLIPFCQQCSVPLWDMFTTSVICAVVNEEREVALIRQGYVSATKHVCVAGIMKPGGSAEETAVREIGEEIGQEVVKLEYIRSFPYPQKEMLMLGYKATVKKADFRLSGEVDSAAWVKYEDALDKLREGSIAWQLVREAIG